MSAEGVMIMNCWYSADFGFTVRVAGVCLREGLGPDRESVVDSGMSPRSDAPSEHDGVKAMRLGEVWSCEMADAGWIFVDWNRVRE